MFGDEVAEVEDVDGAAVVVGVGDQVEVDAGDSACWREVGSQHALGFHELLRIREYDLSEYADMLFINRPHFLSFSISLTHRVYQYLRILEILLTRALIHSLYYTSPKIKTYTKYLIIVLLSDIPQPILSK